MCHVLIIEDDALAAMDIRHVLAAAGATTFAFADTERDAVEAALARPPAVITSDVMLAKGSGVEAIRRIRARLGPLPVIFVTATPDQCEECASEVVLEKPFDPARLARAFAAAAPRRRTD